MLAPVQIPKTGRTVAITIPVPPRARQAFTLVELLVVIAIIAIPRQPRPASTGSGQVPRPIHYLNNLRQFGLALQLYAGDHEDALPYNMGTQGTRQTVASGQFLNWVNNVASWGTRQDNTNTAADGRWFGALLLGDQSYRYPLRQCAEQRSNRRLIAHAQAFP